MVAAIPRQPSEERDAVDITPQEVAETLSMVSEQNLDLRTITMGISLAGCADEDMGRMCQKVYDKITHTAENLVKTADDLQSEYGIPIANKRVSVTPVAQIAAGCPDQDLSPIAHAMDRAAQTLGIDFMGGFSALVQKGIGATDRKLMDSVPEALATTERVCSSGAFPSHARRHQHGRRAPGRPDHPGVRAPHGEHRLLRRRQVRGLCRRG